jgi:Na+/melibiose symporter-like transporter
MIADIVEENEIRTGRRSEGLLVAADAFMRKLVGGVASVLPGLLLAVVAFPPHANPTTLDPAIMHELVWIVLPLTFALGIVATAVLALYRIDRSAHEANVARLGPGREPEVVAATGGQGAGAGAGAVVQGVAAGE